MTPARPPVSEVEQPAPAPAPRLLQVYEPQRQSHLGWRVWVEMGQELIQARELLGRLIWRDVVARYKQSIFGAALGALGPLALTAVFTLLHRAEIITSGDPSAPYPLFAYVGLLSWQMLASGLTRATTSLVMAANLVGKVRFPRETLVLAATGQAIFDGLLGLPALALLLLYYAWMPAWTILFAPLVLLILWILMSGLGLVLALAHAALRDVGEALPLVLLLWMFLTPVIYPPAASGMRTALHWINPASALVTALRDLVFRGTLTMPGPLVVATLFSLLLALGGWRLFHRLEPKIAERL